VSKLSAEHRSVSPFRSFPTEKAMLKTSAVKASPTLAFLATPTVNEYGGEGRLMQQVKQTLQNLELGTLFNSSSSIGSAYIIYVSTYIGSGYLHIRLEL
jgi:hypothetical protein